MSTTPQELIRNIMDVLDNLGSSAEQGTPEVPSMAVLVPVEVDNTDHSDITSPIFPAPDHTPAEEVEVAVQQPPSTCGCQPTCKCQSDPQRQADDATLEFLKRSAGLA